MRPITKKNRLSLIFQKMANKVTKATGSPLARNTTASKNSTLRSLNPHKKENDVSSSHSLNEAENLHLLKRTIKLGNNEAAG